MGKNNETDYHGEMDSPKFELWVCDKRHNYMLSSVIVRHRLSVTTNLIIGIGSLLLLYIILKEYQNTLRIRSKFT